MLQKGLLEMICEIKCFYGSLSAFMKRVSPNSNQQEQFTKKTQDNKIAYEYSRKKNSTEPARIKLVQRPQCGAQNNRCTTSCQKGASRCKRHVPCFLCKILLRFAIQLNRSNKYGRVLRVCIVRQSHPTPQILYIGWSLMGILF